MKGHVLVATTCLGGCQSAEQQLDAQRPLRRRPETASSSISPTTLSRPT
jgi:hypothetical protein